MDRGAWQAIVHRAARVGHDLATQESERLNTWLGIFSEKI